MSGSEATTFQKRYTAGMTLDELSAVMRDVFVDQLGRLYRAAEVETCNLFEYYQFSPRWAPSVRARVEAVLGRRARGKTIRIGPLPPVPNPCLFYERELETLDPMRTGSVYFSYVHGDLNGANIILDAHQNVWIIDFFHAHRGHVLRDLVKLENDILYIYTPVRNEKELVEAARLSDALVGVRDLAAPLGAAEDIGLTSPAFVRAFEAVRVLRGFYPQLVRSYRGPMQWLVAALRYAVHTLSFDESDEWQKRWALYAAARCAERLAEIVRRQGPLRVDWLDAARTRPGRLGLTILPGRLDQQRELDADIGRLRALEVTDVLCLVPHIELAHYGVPDLLAAYRAAGLGVRHLPMVDQKVCTLEEMRETIAWVRGRLAEGGSLAVHCTGGLGRSGLVAACYLVSSGLGAADAIAEVRRARSPRAVESRVQEDFVRAFARAERKPRRRRAARPRAK
jgi:protein-tyrosine phosphatase